jgi:hypothetical protein
MSNRASCVYDNLNSGRGPATIATLKSSSRMLMRPRHHGSGFQYHLQIYKISEQPGFVSIIPWSSTYFLICRIATLVLDVAIWSRLPPNFNIPINFFYVLQQR